MFAITDWALLQFEMILTSRLLSLEASLQAVKLAYVAVPIWSCTMTCVKVSVALTLLRVPLGRRWKGFLYTVTALQVAWFVGNLAYTCLTCIPLAAIWDPSITDARCLPRHTTFISATVGCALSSFTDVLLSVAPMLLVWQLRRPLRERLLVCALTGIGLAAAASSIAKIFIVREWTDAMDGEPGAADMWALSVSIGTLTIVEQFCALLAASSPSLKGPLQRLLKSVGVLVTSYDSRISFIHPPTAGRGEGSATEEKRGESHQDSSVSPTSVAEGDDKSSGSGPSNAGSSTASWRAGGNPETRDAP